MPRTKDNDHIKMLVVLSPSELEAAQTTAIKAGVSAKIAGNTSAFLRYLVKRYTDEFCLQEYKK